MIDQVIQKDKEIKDFKDTIQKANKNMKVLSAIMKSSRLSDEFRRKMEARMSKEEGIEMKKATLYTLQANQLGGDAEQKNQQLDNLIESIIHEKGR